jgi:ABC-2 type transport system ATP-binding protein
MYIKYFFPQNEYHTPVFKGKSMPQVIIEFRNIVKTYCGVKVLNDISFVVEKGEAVAVVGANGSGKSTLFNILLGLLKPDEGSCSIFGIDSEKIISATRGRIGFIADHAGPVSWASAYDLAKLYSKIYSRWDKDRYADLIRTWRIDEYRRLNQLSKGQKRLAEIALIVSINPDILILDEPFDGLDAVMRIKIQKLIRDLHTNENMTIMYATHILTELPLVADRMFVLRQGNIVYDRQIDSASGSPEGIFKELYHEELSG